MTRRREPGRARRLQPAGLIIAVTVVVCLTALTSPAVGSLTGAPAQAPSAPRSSQPNIIIFLTDDQTRDAVRQMPYLNARADWVRFPNTYVENALCCPSRATVLTGQYDTHHGVATNADGARLDQEETLGVWLQRAGYRTGFVGKYLSSYHGSGVPPGWDDWQVPYSTPGRPFLGQYDYSLSANGSVEDYGTSAEDYLGTVMQHKAEDFIRASADGPFLLYYAPTSTHRPWQASPEREGIFDAAPVRHPREMNEQDVSDKPAWIRQRPRLTEAQLEELDQQQRRQWAASVSVDDELRQLDSVLESVGADDNTVVIFMTDNGYSFGAHRWVKKQCAYDSCNRTPMYVRYPGTPGRTDHRLVGNVDIAATVVDIASAQAGVSLDGRSLLPLLSGTDPVSWRSGLLLHWPGGTMMGEGRRGPLVVPEFWGIRTARYKYVELETGERELYDVRRDPRELRNVAGTPARAKSQRRLAMKLDRLRTRADGVWQH